MFENIKKDLKNNQNNWTDQGLWVMLVYRLGRWRNNLQPSILRRLLSFIYNFSTS